MRRLAEWVHDAIGGVVSGEMDRAAWEHVAAVVDSVVIAYLAHHRLPLKVSSRAMIVDPMSDCPKIGVVVTLPTGRVCWQLGSWEWAVWLDARRHPEIGEISEPN